jgi:hypothetical protein
MNKKLFILIAGVAVGIMSLARPAVAIVEDGLINVIGNPSFEDALGGATNPTDTLGDNVIQLKNWDQTRGRGISNPAVVGAVDGSKALQLSENGFTNAGSFTFQTNTGIVGEGSFVTFSVFARYTAVDGAENAQLQIEFNDSTGTRISATTGASIPAATTAFTRFTISAFAPTHAKEVVFTLQHNPAAAAGTTVVQFDSAVGTITNFPIAVDVSASKPRVTKGGAIYISNRIKNVTNIAFNNLEYVATIPEGFAFIDSSTRIDGQFDRPRDGSKIIPIGTVLEGGSKQLGFLLAASSGVQIGKTYELSFFVRTAVGLQQQSAKRVLTLTVAADPVFDEGIIVGKVFDDQNENAVQDPGEHGVPGVKLATEEGVVVVTDPHGRYHIPAVKPGRHVVKIDGHTLPKGTKFISEESILVKNTEGMFSVVDFAAKLPEPQIPRKYRDQLNVMVTPGVDYAKPHLSIELEPQILRMGLGYFEEEPKFQIRTNYGELIKAWRIEVDDEFGDEVWAGYGLNAPPVVAPWNGKTRSREPVGSGVYSYRLVVRDAEGHEDWTPLGYFRVIDKTDNNAPDHPRLNVPAVGNMSIDRDGKQSIPVVAKPKVLVRGTTVPWNEVTINGEPVGINLDGSFQKEFYADPGKQAVTVQTTDPDGNSISYQEEIELDDSYFFMVGLGEQELGLNIFDGNLEVVGREDRFDHGYYTDGRLAFYLKGKLKGKFLIESSYDTDDPRDALFTNLDPDHYYPVYGDGSEINYDAQNTKQRFYILVEMDRSFLKWGSFNTSFKDTKLSTHDRTFSGLKMAYESTATTRYGDPMRGFVVYTADVDQLADHNEFLGTNGSLFYLRNKNVIEGGEKVRVEVRDRISGIATYTRDLFFGTDYEIDYDEGRIILRKPLSSVSYMDEETSNDILKGSDTYLIVDYEFDPQGSVSDRNSGVRGYMQVGDHFRVGGTAVEDRRPDGDYDLRGLDFVGKFGRNTKISAEIARSQRRTTRNAVSFDGGISFTDIATGSKVLKKPTRLFDDAFSVRAETKFRTGTSVSGYLQRIEAGFSNADLIRQAGTEKFGLEARQKVGEYVQLKYRYDAQTALDEENIADVFVTSPQESVVHNAQFKADYKDYLLIAEYQHQDADVYPDAGQSFTTALDDMQFKNAISGKVGYRLSENTMPYLKAQVTRHGTGGPNHQIGGGFETKVMDGKGVVRLEEMVGSTGDSTKFSFDVQTSETSNAYTSLQVGPSAEGGDQVMTTTVGSSSQVNNKSRYYSEREYSTYQTGERDASILGYDTKLTDKWGVDLKVERNQIRGISEVNSHRNAVSAEFSYLDSDTLKLISKYELRLDGGFEDRIHWFFRDTLDWKINEDLKFSARFNRGDTYPLRTDFDPDASTTELNMGLAYRPTKHNRMNVLTRYTWLREVGAKSQFDTPDIFAIETDESAHIFAFEFAYDAFPPYLDLVEKFAYRRTTLRAEGDTFYIGNILWVHRLNFHVIRKWDLILEYRLLFDFELLDGVRHGALVEIDREIMEYFRVGLGYDFSHFNDDLRFLNDFQRNGFYTRLSGKF